MRCQACSVENPDGMRFCGSCGAPLVAMCPSCGTEIPPGNRFCGNCGTPVGGAGHAAAPSPPASLASATAAFAPSASGQAQSPTGLITELRQVSVLFCDLVGFTPLAESKDPEEVRELLSGYFELARGIVDSLRRRG